MLPTISRRVFVVGAAALPFLRIAKADARTPGILTFGLSSYPPSIQPWANTGTAAGTVKLMIHRGLLSYDTKGALRPELAETWTRDGSTAWLFKLRHAVFHNGEAVTSADVKWTLEQVAGPFVLKTQERGVALEVEAFPKYYRPGLPKLKGIRAIAYADENLRVAALQAGDVDLIEYVPWQSMETISNDPKLRLDATDGPFMYLLFNGTKAPFNDARVRKAVAHAIKREDIVNAAFFGRGSPLTHLPIVDSSEFFNPDLKDGWKYDLTLAKKLLADAGYPEGFRCSFLSTAQYGMHKDSAEVVQQNLAAIGIKAELNLPDWATRVTLGNRGQYDLAMGGTAADNNDPDGLANLIDGSLSPSYVRSFGVRLPKIEELLKAGRAEFDPAKRKTIYKEMESLAIAEAPVVGLAWRSQGYAMQRDVTGFKNLPGALSFNSGLTFEETAVG